MKTAIIVGLVAFLGVSTAFAGVKLLRSEVVARVSTSTQDHKMFESDVMVSKFVDGNTTCYVSVYGKYGTHAISCVK